MTWTNRVTSTRTRTRGSSLLEAPGAINEVTHHKITVFYKYCLESLARSRFQRCSNSKLCPRTVSLSSPPGKPDSDSETEEVVLEDGDLLIGEEDFEDDLEEDEELEEGELWSYGFMGMLTLSTS